MDNNQARSRQPLPQNTDAEASLLGAVLIDTDALVKIADIIGADDFFDERHKQIYNAIVQLYDKRSAIDVLTISDQLKSNGYLDSIGGGAYLTELTNYVPTAAHVENYAEIVAQKAVRRRMIAAGQEIADYSFDETSTLKELVEQAESRLFEVTNQNIKQTVTSIENILADSFERLDDLHKDKAKLRGVPTGYRDMDDMLAGLGRSDLIILAARPAMGKAQPLDANVRTPDGWKKMGDLKTGDKLASIDGLPSEVTGVFPQGEEQVYRITFSDGRSTECSASHLWTTHYRSWEKPRVLTTAELIEKLQRQRYQKRLWIDMITGDFGHDQPLPVAPWVLGVLIGEGDLSALRFSTASEHILERMNREIDPELKINHAGNYDYRIVQKAGHLRPGKNVWPNPLREHLKVLGLWKTHSYDKFIPDIYKTASKQLRIELLQGLLDSDGWVERHGTVRFATSSEQLANDVVELARSLGAWATKKTKKPTFTYKGEPKVGLISYVVNITHPEPATLFSLPEKIARTSIIKKRRHPVITSIEPTRVCQTQCIKVSHPTELYITDNYIVTHNTAFVLNLAHNVALYAQEPVLIFSLEMSKEQLVDRLLAMESGVDSWALRTGNLNDADFEKIGQAMGALSEAKILIDDTPSLSISDLRTKARRESHQRPLGLIIVDYLQLMSGGSRFKGSDNRVQEISEISRGLKQVARELNVPLIALSQLSRSVESRSPQIPQLSDLRESGSIEQDADIVAFLYREDYYNPDSERQNILDVLIKKHRAGPVGGIELYFDRERQKISSLDTKHDGGSPFAE
jgi:replicative DNA helicase